MTTCIECGTTLSDQYVRVMGAPDRPLYCPYCNPNGKSTATLKGIGAPPKRSA